jgi:CBS domain-containing protein
MSKFDYTSYPVSKCMTKKVITASTDETVQSICKTMHENNIGSVVIVNRVIDGLRPIGIITERDIIHQIGSVELFVTQTPVRELMSTTVTSIDHDSSVGDAITIMHKKNIRTLPVLGKDGKMVGIITERDILSIIAKDINNPVNSLFPEGHMVDYKNEEEN